MIPVPGGTFLMGSDDLNFPDEQPVHHVSVSAFYIDSTEVTQSDFSSLMGFNPSAFSGNGSFPVEQVTWFDAVLYCNERSQRDGFDTVYHYTRLNGAEGATCFGLENLVMDMNQNGYRLPTEAEWEYAGRAGCTADFSWDRSYPPMTETDTAMINSHAIWLKNSQRPGIVASKKANAWGLYDMSGNVREWCQDWYQENAYSGELRDNPLGPSEGDRRVVRGGSWFFDAKFARSSCRGRNLPDLRDYNLGFRCIRPVK